MGERFYRIVEKLSDETWVTAVTVHGTHRMMAYVDKDGHLYQRRCKCKFDADDRLHSDTGPAVWIPDA